MNEAVALIQRAMQESSQQDEAAPGQDETQNNERWMMTQSSSTAMQEVFRAIGRLAQSKVTVLITGESGTGKELVARALHGHGVRAGGPFVALNAAAIPRDLLEAELFGHERGAFTGANTLRRGRFEEAHGGTLFLDEIGDMPIELQTRLLRVLAEGSFYRVGGAQPVRVDVRIVAATHQPLEQRVEQGLFREDLFHRLNVIRLRLPPLRERTEDIPALANHFLTASARALGVPVKRLTPEALAVLTRFDFPGNVRQLENFCHWLTVMAPGQTVEPADLPPEIRAVDSQQASGAPATQRPPVAAIGTVLPTAMPAQAEPDAATPRNWQDPLRDAQHRLERGEPAVMATLTRQFEKILLQSALDASRGRRVEAATRLGIAATPSRASCASWASRTTEARARHRARLQPSPSRLSHSRGDLSFPATTSCLARRLRPPRIGHMLRQACLPPSRRSSGGLAPDTARPASPADSRSPGRAPARRSWPASWA